MKKIIAIATMCGDLLAVAGTTASTPAVAQDAGDLDTYEICDETTCTVYQCNEFGCSAIRSYPRKREVGDQGEP